jgi:hypothetical protein
VDTHPQVGRSCVHESGFGRKLAGSCLFALPVLGRTIILQTRESCHSFPHMPAFLLPATSVCDISSESRPLDRHLRPAKSLHLSPRSPTAVFSSAGKGAQKAQAMGCRSTSPLPCAGSRSRLNFQLLDFTCTRLLRPPSHWRARPDSLVPTHYLGGFPSPKQKQEAATHVSNFFLFLAAPDRPRCPLLASSSWAACREPTSATCSCMVRWHGCT